MKSKKPRSELINIHNKNKKLWRRAMSLLN